MPPDSPWIGCYHEEMHGSFFKMMACLKTWFVTASALACLVPCLIFASLARAQTPHVKQGAIDLQGWKSTEPLSLAGEWHFFWNEQLTPEQAANRLRSPNYQAKLTKVGTRFRDIVPNLVQDDQGFATYVLVLHNIPDTALSLTALSAYTASDLYLHAEGDGEKATPLASHGRFGRTQDASIPFVVMSGMVPFKAKPDTVHYMVVHVANFHFTWGGFWIPPRIGDEQAIFQELQKAERSNYLILGMFILVFLYNLSFYLRRREDKASLFLACFVAIAILRSFQLAHWNRPFFSDQQLSFELSMKIIFLTMGALTLAFLYFLKACFPKQTPGWMIHLFWLLFGPAMLMVVLTRGSTFGILSEYVKGITLLAPLFVLYVLPKAVHAREEGAIYSLVGTAFLILGGVMDIAYTLGFMGIPTNSTGLGLVIFTACQSQIIAVRFAVAFRKSERLSRSLAKEVERQTRDIKSILKNIRQGIFTIVHPSKKVGEQHSDHLLSLLGKTDLTGRTLDDLLLGQSDLSTDTKSQVTAALDASLGEKSLAFEINEACFVKELRYQKDANAEPQIFEIDWNPILNKQDELEKILVSLRDVTEMRSLREDAEKREEDMTIVMELIRIPEEKFQRFMSKAITALAENRDLIMKQDEARSEIIKRLFMNMHTIKGAARTYFLNAIASAAHDAEQYYAALQRQELEWDSGLLMKDLEEVDKAMRRYQAVGEDRLGWNHRHHIIKIDRAQLAESLHSLEGIALTGMNHQQMERISQVIDRLSAFCYDSLSSIVDEASRGLDSIARDLKKEAPQILVAANRIFLRDQGSEVIYNILIHLFRNSMDHGIETPALRTQRGKPAQGTISLAIQNALDHLVIEFRDDGNGLDLDSIRTKGLEQGLIPPGQGVSDHEIAALIFLSGFSTKSSASEISGRGVGLNAVRSYCERVGARVDVRLEPVVDRNRAAFCFELTLPKQLFWIPQPPESRIQQAS